MKRRPRVPRMPLPLQRIQPRVEPVRDRLVRHPQLKRRVALIRREDRRRRIQGAGGAQAEHAVGDEWFDLIIRERGGFGAHEGVMKARDPGFGDGVEAREGRQVVGGVGGVVGEGDVRGGSRYPG